MKITLHIGVEKTGSTSIQSYLTQNREALLKKGILYAESLSLPNNDLPVAFSLHPAKKSDIRAKYSIPDKPEEIERFRKRVEKDLRREIEAGDPERLIISNEHLTSRLHSIEELEKLFGFLSNFSDDIEMVIYLRRQDRLLESLYSTAIISGNTHDFDTYFNAMRKRQDLHYFALLKRWEAFIPKEKMKIRIYERKKLRNGDIVDDFLDLLDIDRTNKTPIEANISLGYKKTEFLRRFNILYPLSDKKLKRTRGNILQLLYKAPITDEKISLSEDQREALFSDYVAENRKCAQHYLEKEKLFDSEVPECVENHFTMDDMMEIFGFLWMRKQVQIANLDRGNKQL